MTTAEILADFPNAYPSFFAKTSLDVMRMYVRQLSDIPETVLAAVINDLIRTEKFMPSIAQIREAAAEKILNLPSEGGALAEVDRLMSSARSVETEGMPLITLTPAVRRAFDAVGGYAGFRYADDAAVIRGQFGRIYREERAREILSAQSGRLDVAPAPESRQIGSGEAGEGEMRYPATRR
jgi:hypothetical protein